MQQIHFVYIDQCNYLVLNSLLQLLANTNLSNLFLSKPRDRFLIQLMSSRLKYRKKLSLLFRQKLNIFIYLIYKHKNVNRKNVIVFIKIIRTYWVKCLQDLL